MSSRDLKQINNSCGMASVKSRYREVDGEGNQMANYLLNIEQQ